MAEGFGRFGEDGFWSTEIEVVGFCFVCGHPWEISPDVVASGIEGFPHIVAIGLDALSEHNLVVDTNFEVR